MRSYMCDTNVIDAIVDDEQAQRFESLIRQGDLEIVTTHIQEDERAAVEEPSRRAALSRMPRRVVPTGVFVVDVSRLDMARLGSGVRYEEIRHGMTRVKDVIIAETAEIDGIPLVTNDKRFRNQASRVLRVPVLTFSEFKASLRL